MEEKQKKSGLGFAVGLTIICILAIAILSYFVYYLLNARKDDNTKLENLNSQVAVLQSSVNSLSRRVVSNEEKSGEEDIDEIALDLFEEATEVIIEASSTNFEEVGRVEPAVIKVENGKEYHKTVLKYAEAKEKGMEIFGEPALTKFMSQRFLDVDGDLYISEGGATGWELTDVEVEKVSEANGEIKYKATYVTEEEESSTPGTSEFTIKKVNDSYVITAISYGFMGV